MPLKNYIPLFKFIGTLVCPMLYIASFASSNWVEDETKQWGLWSWCFTNFTDESDPEDYVNDSTKCHSISPGDSPAYFEGLRVVACFTLISYIGFFLTFNERESLGKDTNPLKVYFVAAVMTALTMGTLAGNYAEDERWENSDHRLGWCFWVIMASGVLSLLMIPIYLKHTDRLKLQCNNRSNNRRNPSPAAVTPNPPDAAATGARREQRRASIAVSVSSSDSSVALPPLKNTRTTGASRHQRATRLGEDGSSGSMYTGRGYGFVGSEYPVLELPSYNFPPDRSSGLLPNSPPPSYEEVIRADNHPSSAPPPYLP